MNENEFYDRIWGRLTITFIVAVSVIALYNHLEHDRTAACQPGTVEHKQGDK